MWAHASCVRTNYIRLQSNRYFIQLVFYKFSLSTFTTVCSGLVYSFYFFSFWELVCVFSFLFARTLVGINIPLIFKVRENK